MEKKIFNSVFRSEQNLEAYNYIQHLPIILSCQLVDHYWKMKWKCQVRVDVSSQNFTFQNFSYSLGAPRKTTAASLKKIGWRN